MRVRTFKDEANFLKLANDTEFGLMADVFTQDINRALRISSELDSGVVDINCVGYINIQAPFGGTKQPGIGREMSHYALRSFTEPKSVLIKRVDPLFCPLQYQYLLWFVRLTRQFLAVWTISSRSWIEADCTAACIYHTMVVTSHFLIMD